MQYSMDMSATTIALQRSGLVEPIHKETRQFAKPIWGKKTQEKNKIVSLEPQAQTRHQRTK
jgi:hypothetical protein